MAEQGNPKRLTRADAAVVAAVCLLLVFLVAVLFAKPREQAVRRLCAANLAQIGKAMLVYAGENDDALPHAGGPTTTWGPMSIPGWSGPSRQTAYGLAADGSGGAASISASFYLLVKYLGLPPRVFVCKGDEGTTEFKLSYIEGIPSNLELIQLWDFGPPTEAYKHCSYAYHIPYGVYALNTTPDPNGSQQSAVFDGRAYALNTTLDPNMPVAADRSPWISSPAAEATIFPGVGLERFIPDVFYAGGVAGTSEQARMGNSITHQRDGQNVLFLDGRVTFETRSFCGVDRDNIYLCSRNIPIGSADMYGVAPIPGTLCSPTNRHDSVLVHDPNTFGDTTSRR